MLPSRGDIVFTKASIKKINRSYLIMAYIYQITNLVNGKIYIGKTVDTIETRWKKHQTDCCRAKYEHRPLYQAMKKYGVNNFSVKELEECPVERVNEREKYWIEALGSYKHGYNATLGGDGTHYADYDLIYALYLEGKTYKEIHALTAYDHQTIARALNQNGVSYTERQINNIAHISKKVAKIDKQTGEILEIFPSVAEAERQNGNTKHIADVCNGKRKTCKGFRWRYI
jgi:P2-related tail formation protein